MSTVIDAVLRLKDQMTPVLKQAQGAIKNAQQTTASYASGATKSIKTVNASWGEHTKAIARQEKAIKNWGKSYFAVMKSIGKLVAPFAALEAYGIKNNIELQNHVHKIAALSDSRSR